MVLDWMKRRRRARILTGPFPEAWMGAVEGALPFWPRIGEADRTRLLQDVRLMVAEKNWEGCGGLEITDRIRVTIAAQACLLILGLDYDWYDRVVSILVYEHSFEAPDREVVGDHQVQEGEIEALGQAVYRGPVVLSMDSIRPDGKTLEARGNVVVHEFAHKIDFLDGVVNGTPPLQDRDLAARWGRVMTSEFRKARTRQDRGEAGFIPEQGLTDEAEFFAVLTELFYEDPRGLRENHADLHDLLRDFYGRDPALWMASSGRPPS
jgi:Mlc titration factor MtfA (ptsG expression regulator)